jgi:antirestriction protein ArdC
LISLPDSIRIPRENSFRKQASFVTNLLHNSHFSVTFHSSNEQPMVLFDQKRGVNEMKTLLGAVALCALIAGSAQAEVQDRVVSADVPPQVLYQGIVTAATDMCREAADSGDVFDVNRCVAVVVAKTVAEVNKPSLTMYAQTTTPAAVAKRSA